MNLTRRHLLPVLNEIAMMFNGSMEQYEQFEPWAKEQTMRLARAAQSGNALLAFEAEVVRCELEELAESDEVAESARTQRLRQAKEHWLSGLLRVVDQLLADAEVLRA
ncbi:MAG: hypothetical protein DI536_02675 [Archangium gephyra]|uniref:Uncharacterized protein n=1 Tax=Archangium gephyra TaxID=48 RepID=A0A2W5TWL8_9BACT|nr:MAG: hypothetical protein DI536_02675 [Archangium gephyra]